MKPKQPKARKKPRPKHTPRNQMEAIFMNDTVTTLTARHADFAQHSFVPGASMMPALKTMVIGCADLYRSNTRLSG